MDPESKRAVEGIVAGACLGGAIWVVAICVVIAILG